MIHPVVFLKGDVGCYVGSRRIGLGDRMCHVRDVASQGVREVALVLAFFPLKVTKLHQHHRRSSAASAAAWRRRTDEGVAPVRDARARPTRPHVRRGGAYSSRSWARARRGRSSRCSSSGAPVALAHRRAIARAHPVQLVHRLVVSDERSRTTSTRELLRRVRRGAPVAIRQPIRWGPQVQVWLIVQLKACRVKNVAPVPSLKSMVKDLKFGQQTRSRHSPSSLALSIGVECA